MDPKQTLSELLEAVLNEDWEQVKEHAGYLSEWLNKGGFSPTQNTKNHQYDSADPFWV